jgi:alkylation response protein AidB-like acyl-CoA dehydrogenase
MGAPRRPVATLTDRRGSEGVDLDFTEEQHMLREMIRGVCGAYASLDTVRAMEDDVVGYPGELWKQMAELDLIGLMLPSEFGGSEMNAIEGAILYNELGRALAPTPHFVSAVMGAGVLLRAGTTEQQQEWLPRVTAGDAVLSTAWLEPGQGFGPRGVQTRATSDGDSFVLDGVKLHVPFARAASRLVVLARTGDADGDIDLFLVDPTSAGVTLTQQFTIASDTQYQVELAGARVDASSRIGGLATGWSTWHATLLDGIILLAAQAAGGARYTLDLTVQYAKDREQFDKPLGAFQAIAHYLADAATAVDGAETLVYEAAWARANDRSTTRLAPMAKLFACSTFRDVTAMAQQIFGGVGFTLEYDVQLYFRRAKQLQISWWDDRVLEELVTADVLDG